MPASDAPAQRSCGASESGAARDGCGSGHVVAQSLKAPGPWMSVKGTDECGRIAGGAAVEPTARVVRNHAADRQVLEVGFTRAQVGRFATAVFTIGIVRRIAYV